MCLVSACPEGTEKDNEVVEKFVKSGMSCNSNGSGYMFKRKGENSITIRKGFFGDPDKMMASIRSEKLSIHDELVIHHRIRTHGDISAENSHPFVISNIPEEVSATSITINKPCLAHNGYFWHIDPMINLNPKFSDTYAFCRYILGDPNILNLLRTNLRLFQFFVGDIIGGSRVAILYPDRDIQLFGDFTEDGGYYHSNNGYCAKVYDKGGSSFRKGSSNSELPALSTASSHDWLGNLVNGTSSKYDPQANWRDNVAHRKEHEALLVKDEDITVESEGLGIVKTPNAVINSITACPFRIMTVDSLFITLDETNFKDFYFVPKRDFFNGCRNGKLFLGEFDRYDSKAATNTLEFKDRKSKNSSFTVNEYQAISEKSLKDTHFFIVKEDQIRPYFEYMKLIHDIPATEIGKKTLKKAKKTLYDARKKREMENITYDKAGSKKISKKALRLFVEYMEKNMDAVSLADTDNHIDDNMEIDAEFSYNINFEHLTDEEIRIMGGAK